MQVRHLPRTPPADIKRDLSTAGVIGTIDALYAHRLGGDTIRAKRRTWKEKNPNHAIAYLLGFDSYILNFAETNVLNKYTFFYPQPRAGVTGRI